MDWSEVQPGGVIVWRSGKQQRRVLVESVEEEISPESKSRFIWGVEITQHYRPRSRRGMHGWSKSRPFIVFGWNVTAVVAPESSDRLRELVKYVAEYRARWVGREGMNGEGWEPCQEYGHRYTIDPDPEVYSSCVDCGEPHDADEDGDEA